MTAQDWYPWAVAELDELVERFAEVFTGVAPSTAVLSCAPWVMHDLNQLILGLANLWRACLAQPATGSLAADLRDKAAKPISTGEVYKTYLHCAAT